MTSRRPTMGSVVHCTDILSSPASRLKWRHQWEYLYGARNSLALGRTQQGQINAGMRWCPAYRMA
jgi:hypothetical protein